MYSHYIIARCDPPCRPESECVRTKDDTNICLCPKGLRGDQCQHGECMHTIMTHHLNNLHAISVNDNVLS